MNIRTELKPVRRQESRPQENLHLNDILPEFKRRIDNVTNSLRTGRLNLFQQKAGAADSLIDTLGPRLIALKNRKPIDWEFLSVMLICFSSASICFNFPLALITMASLLFFVREKASEEFAKFKSL